MFHPFVNGDDPWSLGGPSVGVTRRAARQSPEDAVTIRGVMR